MGLASVTCIASATLGTVTFDRPSATFVDNQLFKLIMNACTNRGRTVNLVRIVAVPREQARLEHRDTRHTQTL